MPAGDVAERSRDLDPERVEPAEIDARPLAKLDEARHAVSRSAKNCGERSGARTRTDSMATPAA